MPATLRSIRFNGPQQQRGAIGLIAAGTLALVVLFMLLVVDSGRLYFEQRKLQRVADMAALEAATLYGSCGNDTAQTYATTSAGRNGFVLSTTNTLVATCGVLETAPAPSFLRTFKKDTDKAEAIRVIATTVVPTSVAGAFWAAFSKGEFDLNTLLTASAVGATAGSPLAQLTIRTALVNVDSAQSAILNQLIGGLLGGSLNLTAVSWNGLVTTDINLLSYLDQLIQLNTTIGSYDELLKTDLKLTQLIQAAIMVLEKNGSGANVAAKALGSVLDMDVLKQNTQVLKLGDLLSIKNGTPSAGLNTDMKVFDLLQGLVQLSNGNSAATAHIEINPFAPLNLINIDIYTKVIEPPQLSAIGNPALIKGNYTGPDQISVRTAQVKTRIHIGVPVLEKLQPLINLLSSVVSTVAEIVGKLLKLDLLGAVKCVLTCQSVANLTLVSAVDVYIEAASANSYVKDYSCATEDSKTLTAQANTSLANVSIGSAPTNGIFPSTDPMTNRFIINPIRLIDVNLRTCNVAGIFCKDGHGDGGSFNLKVQTELAPTTKALYYASPRLKNINQAIDYQSFGSNDNVLKIGTASGSIISTTYTPPSGKSVTSDLLKNIAELLETLTTDLITALNSVFTSLVNPIIGTLLKALGVNLAVAEVGANLSCNQGGRAQLVL